MLTTTIKSTQPTMSTADYVSGPQAKYTLEAATTTETPEHTSSLTSSATVLTTTTKSTQPPITTTHSPSTTKPGPTTTPKQPSTTGGQPPSCESGYFLNPFSNSCFGAFNVQTNWTEAKKYCEDKGAFLATPHREKCVEAYNDFSWNDFPCNTVFPSPICEKVP